MKRQIRKNQTSDYMEWNTATSLIRKLYKDGMYRMSLLLGCGIMFGLRISDIKRLTWNMLIFDDKFTIIEKKTNKRRVIKINSDFQHHIIKCYKALHIDDDYEECFIGREHKVLSTQRINVILKEIKSRYNLRIQNISTHTMRKTFGRHVFEMAGENAQIALVRLSELFNHSNIKTTKIYLGIRQDELLETYDLLDF